MCKAVHFTLSYISKYDNNNAWALVYACVQWMYYIYICKYVVKYEAILFARTMPFASEWRRWKKIRGPPESPWLTFVCVLISAPPFSNIVTNYNVLLGREEQVHITWRFWNWFYPLLLDPFSLPLSYSFFLTLSLDISHSNTFVHLLARSLSLFLPVIDPSVLIHLSAN